MTWKQDQIPPCSEAVPRKEKASNHIPTKSTRGCHLNTLLGHPNRTKPLAKEELPCPLLPVSRQKGPKGW